MKKLLFSILLAAMYSGGLKSQNEKFGNTLNLGFGLGYYGSPAPAVNLNYEFDIFRNFTLAPFISAMTYRNYRYWGDPYNPYRDYYYRETIIPVGVKTAYYFDEWLRASDRWDFYIGTSLGVAFRSTTWESGYGGDRVIRRTGYTSPLYANMHIGSECHLSDRFGIYLDLSTGFSTFGLAFHF